MVVGDDELHAVEPPGFKAGDEGRPARARLSIRELHAQDLAPALAVDPDRDEDRLRLDHAVEPDLLVPRIEDQIGIRLVEPALGKAPEQSLQALVDPADGARRERVPAQFFRHGLDLAGGHALDIHLGQRTHQGLLGPLKTGQTARSRTAPRGRAGPATPACRSASPARGCNSRTDTRCEQPCAPPGPRPRSRSSRLPGPPAGTPSAGP